MTCRSEHRVESYGSTSFTSATDISASASCKFVSFHRSNDLLVHIRGKYVFTEILIVRDIREKLYLFKVLCWVDKNSITVFFWLGAYYRLLWHKMSVGNNISSIHAGACISIKPIFDLTETEQWNLRK